MAGDAVELSVRFAGTLLVVRRVRRGERFVIGTAPGVDLPIDVSPLTAFPLVDTGLTVRIPIGVDATTSGPRTELALGLVHITITRVRDVVVVVPRPRTSRRIVPYALASLVAQLAIVALASATADIDPITVPVVRAEPPHHVPTRLLPVPRREPSKSRRAAKPRATAASAPAAEATAGDRTPAQQIEAARGAGILGSASLDDLSAITGTKDLAKELADVGPIYDEQAANAAGFGGGAGKFDPASDPAFDSVKTGPYATGGGNRGEGFRLPGEVARPPIMGLTCDDSQCKTVGSLDRFTVRDYLEKRYVDMVKCFERHARRAPRIEVTLHFEIAENGRPNEVHADADASGFGGCLVRLVERVKFPAEQPTQVTYPVAFWRT